MMRVFLCCAALALAGNSTAQKSVKSSNPVTTDPAAGRVIKLGILHGKLMYDKQRIVARPGERLVIEFTNTDEMPHNLIICDVGTDLNKIGMAALALGEAAAKKQYLPDSKAILFATPMVEPEKSHALVFTAPKTPGEYPYVCTFPGHFMLMRGVLQIGKRARVGLSGIQFKTYHGRWTKLPDFSALKPEKKGKLAKNTIVLKVPGAKANHWGAVFTANLYVAQTGSYTINAASDDGARILIDGKIVWEHDGVHPMKQMVKTFGLKAGAHPVEVQYFEGSGGNGLQIALKGPGIRNMKWTARAPAPPSNTVIKVTDTPYIYRTGLAAPGLQKNAYAVAVGLPGGVSCSFDARGCFVRAIWTGGFLDAARDWIGRGGNGATVIGSVFYTNANTFPLRFAGAEDAVVQYRGYRVSKLGYPTFLYTVGKIQVSQSIRCNSAKTGLLQEFTINGAPGDVTYVHPGKGVATSSNGRFSGNELQLKRARTIKFEVEVTP